MNGTSNRTHCNIGFHTSEDRTDIKWTCTWTNLATELCQITFIIPSKQRIQNMDSFETGHKMTHKNTIFSSHIHVTVPDCFPVNQWTWKLVIAHVVFFVLKPNDKTTDLSHERRRLVRFYEKFLQKHRRKITSLIDAVWVCFRSLKFVVICSDSSKKDIDTPKDKYSSLSGHVLRRPDNTHAMNR